MNRGLIFASVALVMCVACARDDSARPRVRLAVGGQAQMVYLPTTLAQTLGFYTEEGVDVELQDFPGGAKALQALMGGSADVVSGFYDHTIQMAAEGRDLVAFVTILRYPGLVLVTSPQSSAEITNVTGLRNRIAGVTTPGSSSHMLLTFLLANPDGPPDSVSVVTIGSAATAIAAIERAKVHAGWMAEPSFTLLTRRNAGVRILADLRDERGTMEALGTKTYPSSVFYSNRKWLDAHRDTAAALARAMLRTLKWMHTHSPSDIAAKTPQAIRGEDDAVFIEALGHSMSMFSNDGLMTADGAAAVRSILDRSLEKVKGATIDLSKTYTNEFVISH